MVSLSNIGRSLRKVLGGMLQTYGASRLLWGGVLLSNALLVGMVSLSLLSSRGQHQANAELDVDNLSSILTHDINGLLDKIDISLQTIADEFRRQQRGGGIDGPALQALLVNQGRYIPEILGLRIADAEGRVVLSSSGPIPAGTSVADRERFHRLSQERAAGTLMDGPELGRVSGKWVIILARRLEKPDGSFAGEVHASLEIAQFGKLLRQVHLGRNGLASLWSGQKRVVARIPENGAIGSTKMAPGLEQLIDSGAEAGPFQATSLIDGIRRTLFFRRIPGHPLYLAVGQAEDDYLAPWRREALQMGGLAAVFSILSVLAAVLIQRSLRIQKSADQDLERARNDLHAILDNVPALVGYWDRDLHSRFGNHAYLDWFGIHPKDIVGKHIRDVIGDDPYQSNAPFIEGVLAGTAQRFERRIATPAGMRLAFVSYIPDVRDGTVAGFYAMIIDLTPLKAARDEADKASHRSRILLQAASDGVHVLDLQGRVREVNEAFCSMLGYSREQMLGMDVYAWEAQKSRTELRQALHSLGEQKTTFETRHRCRDGRVLDVEISSIGVDVDGERLIHCSSRDITERKRAERAMRESVDVFQKIFHASPAGIAMATLTDGCFTEVNDTFAATLGYTPAEFVGRNGRELGLWVEPAQRVEFFDILKGGRSVHNMETVWSSKAGMDMDLLLSAEPMEVAGERHVLAFIMDITHQKEAQRALTLYGQQMEEMVAERTEELQCARQEAERLSQTKSEFLANMSHEIRTPLNAVMGLAQVGLRQSAGSTAENNFRRILDAGRLLLGIVNDILDFSKIEAGKLRLEDERVLLGELIDRVVDLVAPQAQARRQEFLLEEAPGLPGAFRGDALRLTQILVNLLNNALKFTERDGRIILAVEWADGALSFRIKDTGIGMTAEHIARLFQPFEQADGSTTRRFGGTGLGLSICKRLVDLMDGHIQATSVPGRGSEFTVRLPVEELAMETPPPLKGKVVLAGFGAGYPDRLFASQPLLTAVPVEPGSPIPADADLVVLEAAAALTPWGSGEARKVKERGQALGICTAAGQQEALQPWLADVPLLPRPLRARQIARLLQEAAPSAAAPAGPRIQGMRILAAEDNEVNQAVLEEMLAAEGALLTCLENGRLAVERLQQDGPGTWAIMLTDIQMPEMDGFETTRRLHAIDPGLPVIGLTAHALAEERARCLAAGMVEHVAKPFDMETLVAALLRHARQVPDARPATAAALQTPSPACAPPPSLLPQEAPVVDWRGLESRYRGKAAFIGRLMGMAIESNGTALTQLRAAIAGQDFPELAALAHKLKGTAGNLVATPCHALAQRADMAARVNDPAALALAGELVLAVETLSTSLSARLDAAGLYCAAPADEVTA